MNCCADAGVNSQNSWFSEHTSRTLLKKILGPQPLQKKIFRAPEIHAFAAFAAFAPRRLPRFKELQRLRQEMQHPDGTKNVVCAAQCEARSEEEKKVKFEFLKRGNEIKNSKRSSWLLAGIEKDWSKIRSHWRLRKSFHWGLLADQTHGDSTRCEMFGGGSGSIELGYGSKEGTMLSFWAKPNWLMLWFTFHFSYPSGNDNFPLICLRFEISCIRFLLFLCPITLFKLLKSQKKRPCSQNKGRLLENSCKNRPLGRIMPSSGSFCRWGSSQRTDQWVETLLFHWRERGCGHRMELRNP